MKTRPRIIGSFLDQDLYKLTMAQVVWRRFPGVQVSYAYKCRSGADLDALAPVVEAQVEALGGLALTGPESESLSRIRFLDGAFISYLKLFRLNPSHVKITRSPFSVEISGPWLETIFWEIFLLSTISELHFATCQSGVATDFVGADARLTEKINLLRRFASESGLPFRLIEFGTRRRFSSAWQEHVLVRLKEEVPEAIFGTSNVGLALRHGLRPVGTMAHEYLQAFQSLVRLQDSQREALQVWAEVYRGDLGIALTDVICMDAFLRDFDLYFTKLFDGLRHDSGCPRAWAQKALSHYRSMGVDSSSKSLVFSDSLDVPKSLELCREFEPQIRTSYGIGTNLTCDLPGIKPLNQVVKMVACNGEPVAKLSDAPGKSMCRDEAYLENLKRVFRYDVPR